MRCVEPILRGRTTPVTRHRELLIYVRSQRCNKCKCGEGDATRNSPNIMAIGRSCVKHRKNTLGKYSLGRAGQVRAHINIFP